MMKTVTRSTETDFSYLLQPSVLLASQEINLWRSEGEFIYSLNIWKLLRSMTFWELSAWQLTHHWLSWSTVSCRLEGSLTSVQSHKMSGCSVTQPDLAPSSWVPCCLIYTRSSFKVLTEIHTTQLRWCMLISFSYSSSDLSLKIRDSLRVL